MFDNPIYNYPISSLLKAFGCRETKKNMYFSPFRDENNASLHVDAARNLWYDHGAGMGGTNVQLVMLVKRCSEQEAMQYIASLDPVLTENLPQPEQGKRYTILGFENNAGGYAMRSPGTYKATNRAGITTINIDGERDIMRNSNTVAVFEGFFDYLSWLVLQSADRPSCDVAVLNSVNNLDRAVAYIGEHSSILAFLDRDDAGRRCMERLQSLFLDRQIKDMSELYRQHKDLNEMLVQSRGYDHSIKR